MKIFGLLLFVLFVSGTHVIAQQSKPVYHNLVMEGGGIRGIAYGGALAELEKQGVLPGIKRVGGTSAGAIQALLLALGYSPEEISRITYETNVKEFADGRMIFFGGFHRMARKFGWYRGEKFTKWLGKLIEQKAGKTDLTFAELHALAGSRGFRDLYVTGTNLSRQQMEVLSHETYPDMQVRDAVRISMSIPLFFQAVGIDKSGKVVALTKKNVPEVEILVDGGIIGNFPIQLFDHSRYLTAAAGKDSVLINPETIGLRLDRPEQIAYDRNQSGLAPYQITNFNGYMGAFYNMVLENLNRATLKPQDWQRTISINTLQFAPKIRKMTVAEKESLLKSGEQAVKTFFGS
jgi:NTE family protein